MAFKKQTNKTWHRVRVPTTWRPKPGEELIGEYFGSVRKVGEYGEYNVHRVKRQGGSVQCVSGSIVDALFSVVKVGMRVKLVFRGMQQSETSEREYKLFDLFTEEEIELKLMA